MDDEATRPPAPWRRPIGYALATAGTALLVVALLPLRDDVDVLSMGWAFLALVVITAVVGGLGPGIGASVVAFVMYNYFFFPPTHTFRVAELEHIVVLLVFLGLSALIAVVLAKARARAEIAEAREHELRLQQDLTTALVDPSPDDERYGVVLRLIASRLRFDRVDLYVTSPAGSGLDLLTSTGPGEPDLESSDDDRADLERLPLIVGRRSVGLLVAQGERGSLTQAERRILTAFGNQLSLVLERDRLLRASVDQQLRRPATG